MRVRAWPHAFGNPSGRKATANVNAVAVDHVLSFVLLGSYPSSESSARDINLNNQQFDWQTHMSLAPRYGHCLGARGVPLESLGNHLRWGWG